MTIRPPKSLSSFSFSRWAQPSGAEILEAEMLSEQAASIGVSAKKMERALEDFRKSNRDPRRTQSAADAVHAFFIQREMMGLTNQDYVIDFYKIPGEVLARVGASELGD